MPTELRMDQSRSGGLSRVVRFVSVCLEGVMWLVWFGFRTLREVFGTALSRG